MIMLSSVPEHTAIRPFPVPAASALKVPRAGAPMAAIPRSRGAGLVQGRGRARAGTGETGLSRTPLGVPGV